MSAAVRSCKHCPGDVVKVHGEWVHFVPSAEDVADAHLCDAPEPAFDFEALESANRSSTEEGL